MIKYEQRLQCPKCGSFNCEYTVEKIFDYNTRTKKDGWLREKGSLAKQNCGEGAQQITCLNCGYQEYPLSSGPDNFVIEERKIEV